MGYTCPRCAYKTDQRPHYVDHLNKKKTCPAVLEDIPVSMILQELNKPKAFCCTSCDKSFSYPHGLRRHIKVAHAETSNTLNTSITNANTTNTNTTNTNTTSSHNNSHSHNNTTNNAHCQNTNCENTYNCPITINLNVYGNERIDYIEENTELLTKHLKEVSRNGIPDLIERIFLNKEVPENHNVKLKREHHPKLFEVFVSNGTEGGEWKHMKADEIINDMIHKGLDIMIRQNGNMLSVSNNPTSKERDDFDWRNNTINNIKTKKRGSRYVPIRDMVMTRFRESKRSNN